MATVINTISKVIDGSERTLTHKVSFMYHHAMPAAQASDRAASVISRCKALADETRIAIVALLRDGERCVCELNDALEVSQPLLSFHLKVLKEAGLLTDRRAGRWVYYSLDRRAVEQLEKFLANLRTRRKPAAPSGRCCD
jgi:ArsR family transcriptional regulator